MGMVQVAQVAAFAVRVAVDALFKAANGGNLNILALATFKRLV
jgi:hypothetical protein